MALDLPALERPAKATSAPRSGGQSAKVGELSKYDTWEKFRWDTLRQLVSEHRAHCRTSRGSNKCLNSREFLVSGQMRGYNGGPFYKPPGSGRAVPLRNVSALGQFEAIITMYKRFISQCGLISLAIIGLVLSHQAVAQNVQQLVATCAACHGTDGNGPIPDYPKLAGLGEKYLLKQLRDIQAAQQASDEKPAGAREVPLMAGLLVNLSDDDLQAIAAFYANQSMTLTGATPNKTVKLNSGETAESLDVGENLYRYGNQRTGVPACSGCHSPTGAGNAPAAFPRLGGQYPNYVAQQLRNFRGGERTNDGEAQVMRQVAELMSDAEITAVANYISGLH